MAHEHQMELLGQELGWVFAYASRDPHETRCLVQQPEPTSAPHVAEWVVRQLPSTLSSNSNNARPAFSADKRSLSRGLLRGLDAQLEDALRSSNGPRPALPHADVAADLPDSAMDALERLYDAIPRYYSRQDQKRVQSGLWSSQARSRSPHLTPLRGVFSSARDDAFAVFEYEASSMQDVLRYNRHVLQDEGALDGPEGALADLKRRFMLFQVWQVLRYLHDRGLAWNGLQPSTIFLSDNLWVRLGPWPCSQSQENAKPKLSSTSKLHVPRSLEEIDPRSITERWCDGDVSNFEYLMMLNNAAGRRMVDGAFHPFLPWVTDFRGFQSGWRDLTKTKFRLNKGDAQLDRTYESSVVPHHITESLSEITYYIYMARRTPMALLRQVVRSNFQPKEYPGNMARMFDWTPDECIPEFYTDARVFESLHGDSEMEDLQLPDWCSDDPHAFIRGHRAMLESEEVSRHLHSWIDLNFGVSLSGDRAVREKNVPLKVHGDAARWGKSPGFVQIFDVPHPSRNSSREMSSDESELPEVAQQVRLEEENERVRRKYTKVYRPSGMKHQVSTMLSKATTIANEAQDLGFSSDSGTILDSSGKSMAGVPGGANGQGQVTSPASTLESKTQVIARLRQRKKSKSRARFQGLELPGSPPHVRDAAGGSMRSPTVSSRLATVLPHFFQNELSLSGGPKSGNTNGSGGAGTNESESPPATAAIPVGSAGAGVTHQQTSGNSGGSDELLRVLSVTTPQNSGNSHASTSAGRLAPTGSPHTTSTHIFRDLWQQLSKSDDEEADLMSGDSGIVLSEFDWQDTQYDALDETGLQLLHVGLPIQISETNEFQQPLPPAIAAAAAIGSSRFRSMAETSTSKSSSLDLETRARLRGVPDAVVDSAYALPPEKLTKVLPETANMSELELAQAADWFALGCVIAELYTLTPLFSQRSIVEYLDSYADAMESRGLSTISKDSDEWLLLLSSLAHSHEPPKVHWNDRVTERLKALPMNLKNAVLALLHPDPRERLLMTGVLDGEDVFSQLQVLQNHDKKRPMPFKRVLADEDFCPAQSPLFPTEFQLLYRFLSRLHRSKKWSDQFATTLSFLPALMDLQVQQFRILLPVIKQFFQSEAHEPAEERVALAVVFLLRPLGKQISRTVLRMDMLQDVLKLYESSELSCLMKICLSSPEVLASVLESFGSAVLLDSFFPVLIDWLVAGTSCRSSNSNNRHALNNGASSQSLSVQAKSTEPTQFAPEAYAVAAIGVGELASPQMLGPSLAAKYVLPSLLQHLGRIRPRWTKLTEPTSVVLRKKDSVSERLNGRNHDGIHVTFLRKASLYEPHYLADAVLLVCREVSELPICQVLLPHLFEVLPKLVELAESIGAVQLDGVPDELGREIYVILRMLRHVIRSFSDSSIQREILTHRGREPLLKMLGSIEPPLLHPRTAAAILTAAKASSSSTSSARKKILHSLSYLKPESSQDLRAFTVVGLARTIVAICQKLGADATLALSSVVQAVNAFLTRCSVVYAELEISNFQWAIASEIVSELCVPLRSLLGRELFDKHFGIVQNSSVLQLLLLPLGGERGDLDSRRSFNNTLGRNPSMRQRIYPHDPTGDADQQQQMTRTMPVRRPHSDCAASAPSEAATSPELIRFAYRTVCLNAVKATSFGGVPMELLHQPELGQEILHTQEERRKRKASWSATLQRSSGDLVWLRGLVRHPFTPRATADPSGDPNGGHTSNRPPVLLPSTSLNSASRRPIGSSWFFQGEIHHSFKAHSSGIRTLSVDDDEEVVFSGSKHGMCRVWRLSNPTQTQAAVQMDGPALWVRSAQDGTHAVAAEPACVHIWDIRTSQTKVKLPFADESVQALGLMRVAPTFCHHVRPHTMGLAGGGGSGRSGLGGDTAADSVRVAASAMLAYADVVVATSRKVVSVDLRCGPRIVTDWRVDSRENAALASLTIVVPLADGQSGGRAAALLAVGTAHGLATLLDPRTGRHVSRWQALESKIIKMVQFSASQILVVGADKEARVWQLQPNVTQNPRLVLMVSGLPEGLREPQVTVQTYADCTVMYVANGAKVFTLRLPDEPDAAARAWDVPAARVDIWPLVESINGGKLTKSRMMAPTIALLPMRQMLLLGADDGSLRMVL